MISETKERGIEQQQRKAEVARIKRMSFRCQL